MFGKSTSKALTLREKSVLEKEMKRCRSKPYTQGRVFKDTLLFCTMLSQKGMIAVLFSGKFNATMVFGAEVSSVDMSYSNASPS